MAEAQEARKKAKHAADVRDLKAECFELRVQLDALSGRQRDAYDVCDAAVAALRAENETLRSDLRLLQDAVAELTHATTEAFDNCHATQRAYTDRAVGERPEPGSTFERMIAYVRAAAKPVLSPSLEFRLEQSIRFLAAELDQVRR